MTETDNAVLIAMASEIVAAYLAKNHVQAAEMPALISTVHAALAALGAPEPAAVEAGKPVPAVPVRKSVTDEHLISLEDGKRYQALKRHLTKLGMTPAEYRAKWGLPGDYPMVAPAYARKRSELAKSIGFGSRRRRA